MNCRNCYVGLMCSNLDCPNTWAPQDPPASAGTPPSPPLRWAAPAPGPNCRCTDTYCCTFHRQENDRQAFRRRLGIDHPNPE